MKKIIVTGILGLAVSGSVMAATATACSAGAATAVATSSTSFIKSGFTPVCSANSIVNFDQDTGKMWGSGVSTKGASSFKGNTNGGAVQKSVACSANPCAQGDVDTALTAALAMGSS